MLSHISKKFKQNPSVYYSFSIAATWAGAGSFIVGTRVAQESGLFPWLLWALGNTLCCIVFGLFANSFPKLRQVAATKPIQILMGLMCIFQIWINMNGIYEMLSPTIIGSYYTYWIVYGLSVFFIIFYLKRATFRNVATDNFTWIADNRIFSLGIDDMQAFDEIIAELDNDFDIPGYDPDLLKTLTIDLGGADDLMSGYGIITDDTKADMQRAADTYERKEQEFADEATRYEPQMPIQPVATVSNETSDSQNVVESPAEKPLETAHEPLKKQFVICPKCGERIWL